MTAQTHPLRKSKKKLKPKQMAVEKGRRKRENEDSTAAPDDCKNPPAEKTTSDPVPEQKELKVEAKAKGGGKGQKKENDDSTAAPDDCKNPPAEKTTSDPVPE